MIIRLWIRQRAILSFHYISYSKKNIKEPKLASLSEISKETDDGNNQAVFTTFVVNLGVLDSHRRWVFPASATQRPPIPMGPETLFPTPTGDSFHCSIVLLLPLFLGLFHFLGTNYFISSEPTKIIVGFCLLRHKGVSFVSYLWCCWCLF